VVRSNNGLIFPEPALSRRLPRLPPAPRVQDVLDRQQRSVCHSRRSRWKELWLLHLTLPPDKDFNDIDLKVAIPAALGVDSANEILGF
jgi:hypothetical protein